MCLSTSATPLMDCGSFLTTAWKKQGQGRHPGQNLRAHITVQAVSHGGQKERQIWKPTVVVIPVILGA